MYYQSMWIRLAHQLYTDFQYFFSLFHRSTTDFYFPQVFAIGSEDAAVKENVTAVAQFVQFAMTQCANCTMTNLSLQ